ncbi:MAG: hypothetical protein AB2L07_00785 [Thermoanaerobaculaceae bacterium]
MRQWGRLSLELLFVALLYTAVGVVLGVFSVGWGRPLDVVRLLLQNLLAIVPLVFFIWKVEGSWWSVGGACVLTLAVLQIVVPRMEMMLERGQTLIQLPSLALNAVGAAAAAVTALMMMLRSWKNGGGPPPYLWPAGEPASYLWRIPVSIAGYSLLHLVSARFGRVVFGQSSHPALGSELLQQAAAGTIVMIVVFGVSAHLGARSRRRTLVLLAIIGLVLLAGRWDVIAGWPFPLLLARVGLRLVADAGFGLLAVALLLQPHRDRLEASAAFLDASLPDGDAGEASEGNHEELGA